MPPQLRQGGSSSPASTLAQGLLHRSGLATAHAHDRSHGAVHLDDQVRVDAGSLVQLVDVLRHDGVELPRTRQLDDREVAGVRLGVPGRRVAPSSPGLLAHLGIVHVVLKGGHLLGRGVLRPDAVRAPEVGDARVGRDARAGQHDDALALLARPPSPDRWRTTDRASAWPSTLPNIGLDNSTGNA